MCNGLRHKCGQVQGLLESLRISVVAFHSV